MINVPEIIPTIESKAVELEKNPSPLRNFQQKSYQYEQGLRMVEPTNNFDQKPDIKIFEVAKDPKTESETSKIPEKNLHEKQLLLNIENYNRGFPTIDEEGGEKETEDFVKKDTKLVPISTNIEPTLRYSHQPVTTGKADKKNVYYQNKNCLFCNRII